MVCKVDLNSNDYFSTNNNNTASNRTFAMDWSFLNDGKSYLMNYNFQAKHSGTIFYPPSPMTNNTTVIDGESYTANASSTGAYNPFNGFDFDVSTHWRSGQRYSSEGVYNNAVSTNTTAGLVYGEWLELQLPRSIILDRFYIQPRLNIGSTRPEAVKILATNNTANAWNVLYETNSIDLGNEGTTIYLDFIPPPYSFYRIVI